MARIRISNNVLMKLLLSAAAAAAAAAAAGCRNRDDKAHEEIESNSRL